MALMLERYRQVLPSTATISCGLRGVLCARPPSFAYLTPCWPWAIDLCFGFHSLHVCFPTTP